MATQDACGFQYWPMFSLDTGEHVGCCGLQPRDPAAGVLELGYYVRHGHWGRGYAAEAAQAVISHAFGALGVRGLFAGHHEDNQASRRILENLGFRYTHHEFYPPAGLDEPCYLLRGNPAAATLAR